MPNELDYTKYDFDTIVAQLENRLKATPAWRDTYESSTGSMLIQLLAYVANLTLYYIERRAEESYILTAQNRSSVINLVKLLNYNPKRVTSATGVLTFYLTAANSYNITIPKWTECQTSGGVKFLTSEPSVIIAGGTEIEVNGIQGELVTKNVTGDGTVDQEIILSETNVENSLNVSSLIVTIDGVAWTKVSSFLSSTNTSTHYRVINNLDDTVTIKFGNDIKGLAPVVGAVIVITYVLSAGVSGSVYSNNSVTTLNDTITNSNDDTVTDISVTNADRSDATVSRLFLGGDAKEDIEEIRTEAPQVFATGDRAVTKSDFVAILENMAGVVDANVWGENEEAADAGTTAVVSMLNKIKISMILQNWQLPDTVLEATVSAALYNQSMIAVKYEFVDPIIIQVIASFAVVVASAGSSLSDVQDTIETALAAQFALGTTSVLGTSIRYSNVVRAIDALDDVEYHTLTLKIYKVLDSTYISSSDYGELLAGAPIKLGTVELFIDSTRVAIDDKAGLWVDESPPPVVTGNINYVTGEVLVDFDDAPAAGAVVSVRYEQDRGGDIEVGRNEICQLNSTEITSLSIISS